MLAPFAPFAAEELWRVELGEPRRCTCRRGPRSTRALAAEDTVTMVVQVDGKLRDKAEVPADIDEADALELARGSEKVHGRDRRTARS